MSIAAAVLLFFLSLVFAVVALLGLISVMRWKPAAPIDWGDHESAVYRREAILRDEIQNSIRTNRINDQRRITKRTAAVLSNITEPIHVLPQPE